MRHGLIILLSAVLLGGCASPVANSADDQANYRFVFSTVNASQPIIVHSHVERVSHNIVGLFPTKAQYNGEWQFEFLASPAWVAEVKRNFTQEPTDSAPLIGMPVWFLPSPENYSAWKMQHTSHPNAHMYIEKKPESPDRIRVFIQRH